MVEAMPLEVYIMNIFIGMVQYFWYQESTVEEEKWSEMIEECLPLMKEFRSILDMRSVDMSDTGENADQHDQETAGKVMVKRGLYKTIVLIS